MTPSERVAGEVEPGATKSSFYKGNIFSERKNAVITNLFLWSNHVRIKDVLLTDPKEGLFDISVGTTHGEVPSVASS